MTKTLAIIGAGGYIAPQLMLMPQNDDGTIRNSSKMAITSVLPSKPACATLSILLRLVTCWCEASSG
jgi:hypothetical protein